MWNIFRIYSLALIETYKKLLKSTKNTVSSYLTNKRMGEQELHILNTQPCIAVGKLNESVFYELFFSTVCAFAMYCISRYAVHVRAQRRTVVSHKPNISV